MKNLILAQKMEFPTSKIIDNPLHAWADNPTLCENVKRDLIEFNNKLVFYTVGFTGIGARYGVGGFEYISYS